MTLSLPRYADVLLDGHLAGSYSYRVPQEMAVAPGDWAVVPWGRQQRVGIVESVGDHARVEVERVRDLDRIVEDLPPMPPGWFELLAFAAGYYHANPAELALAGVPKLLRTAPARRARVTPAQRLAAFDAETTANAGGGIDRPVDARVGAPVDTPGDAPVGARAEPGEAAISLTTEQRAVIEDLIGTLPAAPGRQSSGPDPGAVATVGPPKPRLLQGVTGSGKTEVYLGWVEAALASTPTAQVLMLVPEIGLTPALERQLRRRFAREPIAVLHSDMPEGRRASHWLAAAAGRARIVVGTRSAALVPMPSLVAIVVDEEHDLSFKQQEGVRFSARDLAISRAALAGIPIVLGSATPSLESWHNAGRGRYRLLRLTGRPSRLAASAPGGSADGSADGSAGNPSRARIELVPLRDRTQRHGLAEPVIHAVSEALRRGEQSLIYLNRRGYSPVLACPGCGWLSRCDQCDAYRVLHAPAPTAARSGRYRLICHHCASERPSPRACPDCGEQDLTPLGRGTQRLEEGLRELFPSARIARLDRDVASHRGAVASVLAAAHAGEVDLLVGTQMLAKGHDFRRLTQVVVADADAGLFASDFRAPERLFATLVQVSGRAGRHRPQQAATWVQTRFPEHPLFDFVRREDYVGFAAAQLAEREAQRLPPCAHQALVVAQARRPDHATGFLEQCRAAFLADAEETGLSDQIAVCDPVPMPLSKLRGLARSQLLVEAGRRAALHHLLTRTHDRLHALATAIGGGLGWSLIVDPIEI
jgi:primosomal protein N' (replication factor Y)